MMGRVSFTEYFHLLLTGEEPTEEQRFVLDLLLLSIAEHGLMPSNVAARMTLAADPGRSRAPWPRGSSARARSSSARRRSARGCSPGSAEDALAKPLEAFHAFFLDGRPFVGGEHPSIADLRWAATLEFLRAIDYDFPTWAEEYLGRVEETLGDAYSEPVADVRGYIEHVRS